MAENMYRYVLEVRGIALRLQMARKIKQNECKIPHVAFVFSHALSTQTRDVPHAALVCTATAGGNTCGSLAAQTSTVNHLSYHVLAVELCSMEPCPFDSKFFLSRKEKMLQTLQTCDSCGCKETTNEFQEIIDLFGFWCSSCCVNYELSSQISSIAVSKTSGDNGHSKAYS